MLEIDLLDYPLWMTLTPLIIFQAVALFIIVRAGWSD